MDFKVISCTTTDEIGFASKPLGKSLDSICWTDAHIFYNNTRGLSECYNEALEMYPDIALIFVHDDVEILDSDFYDRVEAGFAEFDVLGLAGTSSWTVRDRALWHFSDRDYWSGRVWHEHEGRQWCTTFGDIGRRCIVLDGLFIACQPGISTRFDERFSFHHYDLDFCLECHMMGLTMGTINVNVVHHSVGDWNSDPVWHESNSKFLKKWRDRI